MLKSHHVFFILFKWSKRRRRLKEDLWIRAIPWQDSKRCVWKEGSILIKLYLAVCKSAHIYTLCEITQTSLIIINNNKMLFFFFIESFFALIKVQTPNNFSFPGPQCKLWLYFHRDEWVTGNDVADVRFIETYTLQVTFEKTSTKEWSSSGRVISSRSTRCIQRIDMSVRMVHFDRFPFLWMEEGTVTNVWHRSTFCVVHRRDAVFILVLKTPASWRFTCRCLYILNWMWDALENLMFSSNSEKMISEEAFPLLFPF